MKALDDYAAHCQRQGPQQVWAQHIDIWSEPVGELGVPVPVTSWRAMSVFAALVPFMVIPTVGVSWLVVDRSDTEPRHVCVVKLYISHHKIDCASWVVPLSIADDASMEFGTPETGMTLHPNSQDALVEVAKGRLARIGWDDDIDFSRAVDIAEGLLP